MTKKDKVILRLFRLSAFIIIISVIVTGYSVNKVAYQKGFEAGQKNISWGKYNISEIISFFEFDNSLFDQTSFSFVDRGLEQCYSDKKHPTLALCNYQKEKWVMIKNDGTWTASWRSP